MIETAYHYLYWGALLFLGAGLVLTLVRTIRGPRLADRIMGVNMTGSFASMCIVILSRLLEEPWLLDVALIYGMISFLAVVVLSKSFITVHFERLNREADRAARTETAGAEPLGRALAEAQAAKEKSAGKRHGKKEAKGK